MRRGANLQTRGEAVVHVEELMRCPGMGGGPHEHRPLDGDAARGHFAAMEEPGLLLDDVRGFFQELR